MAEIPKSIKKKIKEKKIDIESIEGDCKEISDYISIIMANLSFIRHFILSIKDDYESDFKKDRIIVKSTLRDLFDSFKPIYLNKKIEPVKLNVYPDDLFIYMNKSDFYSIFVNLLTNSIKALDLLHKKENKIIKVTVEKQSYNLKITFSNNGPAIPEKYLGKIFERFVSRYKEGTGLGLTITREILDEYTGTVEAKLNSEFDPGATFEIKIPLEVLKK